MTKFRKKLGYFNLQIVQVSRDHLQVVKGLLSTKLMAEIVGILTGVKS